LSAALDILYATESLFSQTSTEPILEDILTILPPIFKYCSICSVKKVVPVTLTSKVFLKEVSSGSSKSKSGPIPALLIKMSILILSN
jgi:hypothetical protein